MGCGRDDELVESVRCDVVDEDDADDGGVVKRPPILRIIETCLLRKRKLRFVLIRIVIGKASGRKKSEKEE